MSYQAVLTLFSAIVFFHYVAAILAKLTFSWLPPAQADEKRKTILWGALAVGVAAWGSWAATFYIDPTCAVGGNGTTNSCAGGSNAPLAGITSLTSNNTYYFKSGTTLVKTAPININGQTNVVAGIYGGTERARVTQGTTNHFALYIHDATNVAISDMSFTATRETVTYHSAIYIDESTTTDNITLTNCEAKDSIGNGLSILVGVSNVLVDGGNYSNNTFTAAGSITLGGTNSSGILVAGASYVTVKNATINNNGYTAQSFDPGQGQYINEGRGITIQDSGATPSTYIALKDSTLIGNGDRIGTEGSAIEGANSQFVSILGNYTDGSTAAEIKRSFNNCTISGNIFRGASSAVFQYGFYTTDSATCRITNNTFISTANLVSAVVYLSSPGTGSVFRNNLLILPKGNDRAAILFDKTGTSWAMSTWDAGFDYNAIWGPSTTSFSIENAGAVIRTLAGHQAAYPNQCVNCISAIDPQLAGGASPATAEGFRLKSTSPLRRAGKDLNLGNIQDCSNRAFLHPPSIGACEATSGDEAAPRAARQ